MLVVCGTDKFQGVEYVCCPKGEIVVVLMDVLLSCNRIKIGLRHCQPGLEVIHAKLS